MKIRITAIRKASYPDVLAILRIAGSIGLLFCAVIPIAVVATLATFAAVQEGHYIRTKRVL